MNIFPLVMMIAYICVLVYVVQLLGRLVRAVEYIARKIGSSSET